MKKIINSLILISLFVIGFSCEDPELDPLQFANIQKGTIIALRGPALNSVYVAGKPIAEIFPRIATGTEKFKFEAEILAEDPSTVASVDIYVIKKPSLERVLLKNIPASSFAKGAYPNPSAAIELTIQEVFTKLGLPSTFPLDATTVNTLLTTYKFGIGVESDINLTDGSKVLAAEIVAAGLFQSNQFYPAMILTWAITDYCTYISNWDVTYNATELSEFTGSYGPYDAAFIADGTNKFTTDNFYDSGWPLTMEFTPSTSVATQTVKASGTVTTGTGNVYVYSGTGVYNQCLGEVALNLVVTKNGEEFDILVWKLVKK
jgi:hypothetical protein